MAENRARSAGQDGRDPGALPRNRATAHRIDTLVHPMQPSDSHPVRHRPRLQPDLRELTPMDDAVLPRRERRDPLIRVGWAEF